MIQYWRLQAHLEPFGECNAGVAGLGLFQIRRENDKIEVLLELSISFTP
jgi:hypothetical protein